MSWSYIELIMKIINIGSNSSLNRYINILRLSEWVSEWVREWNREKESCLINWICIHTYLNMYSGVSFPFCWSKMFELVNVCTNVSHIRWLIILRGFLSLSRICYHLWVDLLSSRNLCPQPVGRIIGFHVRLCLLVGSLANWLRAKWDWGKLPMPKSAWTSILDFSQD